MATQNIFDLTDTWNAGGTTFTAIKMSVTDTASASGSLLMDLQVGGVSQFSVSKAGAVVVSNSFNAYGSFAVTNAFNTVLWSGASFGWAAASGVNPTTVADTILARDAANTLAQRNGTNAQAFRVYGSYTDASNYERLNVSVSASEALIENTAAGTGTLRSMRIRSGTTLQLNSGSSSNIDFGIAGTYVWRFNPSGHLLAATDNTYDIGASGATRPRNLYLAGTIASGTIVSTGSVTAGPGSYLKTGNGNVQIAGPSDGVMGVYNANANDFGRLQFGGTTSSFPALKRSSADLHVRLADDSAYAKLVSAEISSTAAVKAYVSTAIAAGGTAAFLFSSTGSFGVFFGSGAPTLSAAKGSLYLRSDGSGVNDRMYVNTDSATTWTAVVTAA